MPSIVQGLALTEDFLKTEAEIASYPDSLNSKETKKKKLFIQAVLTILKELLQKLAHDAFLRQKMLEDLNFQDKIDRVQAIKDAWEAFRHALLREITPRLNATGYSSELAEKIAEKLADLSLQLQQLVELEAELEAEQAHIEDLMHKHDTAISEISEEVTHAVADSARLSVGDWDVLENKIAVRHKEVDDTLEHIELWLKKQDEFIKKTKAAETSFNELTQMLPRTEEISSTTAQENSDMKDIVSKLLGAIAIASTLKPDTILSYQSKLGNDKKELDSYTQTIRIIRTGGSTPFWAKPEISSALVTPYACPTTMIYKIK